MIAILLAKSMFEAYSNFLLNTKHLINKADIETRNRYNKTVSETNEHYTTHHMAPAR